MNYCRDVSVGIGTPKELDSPGSEAWCSLSVYARRIMGQTYWQMLIL
jgi:hypothetical protein